MALDPPDMLLKKARDDQRLLATIAGLTDATDEQVGFTAQQAVEKSIKSVLSRRGIRYRKTHDLSELVAALDEHQVPFPRDLRGCDALTPFAAQFRYDDMPEVIDPAPKFDRAEAVRLATGAVEWATGLAEG